MTAEKEISMWVKALLALLEEGKRTKRAAAAKRLAAVLLARKKEYLLPKIVKLLERAYLKKNRIELFLARPHSRLILGKIKRKLLAILGRKKNICIKIEQDLIGGFRAKTSSLLIKASVKDFLNELKSGYNK